jgi:ADP-heptose:LPS heptosyltransferase
MSGSRPSAVWVFHRGALGDSVLLWPLLRAERRAGRVVVLVTDGGKALLAERELGVIGIDAEQPRFNALWREGASVDAIEGVGTVLCAGGGGDPVGAWGRNIRAMFPGAVLEVIGRPSRLLYRGDPVIGASVRGNPGGAVVLHIGAGSEEKRWAMGNWDAVVAGLGGGGIEVAVIAGEVEQERLSALERRAFDRLGGRFIADLGTLADLVRGAQLFVGCDSGPTHLAAAMGVPTLAIFGPTDPAVWGPIGPAVRVLAPVPPRGMDWLAPATVLQAMRELP